MTNVFNIVDYNYQKLGLDIVVRLQPHPDKIIKGGEDSFFINCNNEHTSIGVADGVGGWISEGIDSGLYSRELMSHVFDYMANSKSNNINDTQVKSLIYSKNKTMVKGSSTALVLTVCNNYLYSANIGDSSYLLIRNNVVIYKSPCMQHSFNYPYQLQYDGGDSINNTNSMKIPIELNDIIIMGTDGLFDNIYTGQILRLLSNNNDINNFANQLLNEVIKLSNNNTWISPFAYEAKKHNIDNLLGGKLDDITIIIAKVIDKETEKEVGRNFRPLIV
tara:strand:- start:256 stop:1083 length:828 start_codon:yes stop_codon:yes gene_type:complete